VISVSGKRLTVATPMYGGMCSGHCTVALMQLAEWCLAYRVKMTPRFLFNESLISRARNYLADAFMRSDDDYLMWIDADIDFDPLDPLRLMEMAEECGAEVIAGAYPMKAIDWTRVRETAIAGGDEDAIALAASRCAFNALGGGDGVGDGRLVEVAEAGTGFMLTSRAAYARIAAANPGFAYRPDHGTMEHFDGSREIMAYFQDPIEDGRHLPEDYFFCKRLREAGGRVWLAPDVRLRHVGTHVFTGRAARG
jgi:hypothetical protein